MPESDESTAATMVDSDLSSSSSDSDGMSNCDGHDNDRDYYDQEGLTAATPPRFISFDRNVRVREHNVAVGDHPMTSFPLTLDWESAPEKVADIDFVRHSRHGHYKAPRHLSYAERRQRLFDVNTMFDDDSEQRHDVNVLVQNAWEADYASHWHGSGTSPIDLTSLDLSQARQHDAMYSTRIPPSTLRRSQSFFEFPTGSSHYDMDEMASRKHVLRRTVSFDDRVNVPFTQPPPPPERSTSRDDQDAAEPLVPPTTTPPGKPRISKKGLFRLRRHLMSRPFAR